MADDNNNNNNGRLEPKHIPFPATYKEHRWHWENHGLGGVLTAACQARLDEYRRAGSHIAQADVKRRIHNDLKQQGYTLVHGRKPVPIEYTEMEDAKMLRALGDVIKKLLPNQQHPAQQRRAQQQQAQAGAVAVPIQQTFQAGSVQVNDGGKCNNNNLHLHFHVPVDPATIREAVQHRRSSSLDRSRGRSPSPSRGDRPRRSLSADHQQHFSDDDDEEEENNNEDIDDGDDASTVNNNSGGGGGSEQQQQQDDHGNGGRTDDAADGASAQEQDDQGEGGTDDSINVGLLEDEDVPAAATEQDGVVSEDDAAAQEQDDQGEGGTDDVNAATGLMSDEDDDDSDEDGARQVVKEVSSDEDSAAGKGGHSPFNDQLVGKEFVQDHDGKPPQLSPATNGGGEDSHDGGGKLPAKESEPEVASPPNKDDGKDMLENTDNNNNNHIANWKSTMAAGGASTGVDNEASSFPRPRPRPPPPADGTWMGDKTDAGSKGAVNQIIGPQDTVPPKASVSTSAEKRDAVKENTPENRQDSVNPSAAAAQSPSPMAPPGPQKACQGQGGQHKFWIEKSDITTGGIISSYPLSPQGPTLIGPDAKTCLIVLEQTEATHGPVHARISPDDEDKLWIHKVDEEGSTRVNGFPLYGTKKPLKVGDQMLFGQTEFGGLPKFRYTLRSA